MMKQSLMLAISIIVLLFIVLLIWRWIRKKYAIKKVKERTDEEKLIDINEALKIYGFLFDVRQDIVYSSMYPEQRKFGYCRLYDEVAPLLNMIIQCEPIYFQYDGRRWLIEFWKGQYGMTTGGEVGVYVTDKNNIDIPGIFTGTFYESVSDNELLQMQYYLNEDGQKIIKRKDRHWWLTGFDVGKFSRPDQLSMQIQIQFPYVEMQKAFIKGLYNAGYTNNDIVVKGSVVQIVFKTPKTQQPLRYNKLIVLFIQMMNRFYCNLFNWKTRHFTRVIDKIDFLRIYYPALFSFISNSKRSKKIEKIYKDIQGYLNQ